MTAHELLQSYLSQQQAKGLTHVRLTDSAREKMFTQKSTESLKTPPNQPMDAAKKQSVSTLASTEGAFSAPIAAADFSKKEELKRLALQAEGSESIKALGTLRDVMVFATGSEDAEIMFIGEAPGAEEEKNREPFVGPAGQLLTRIIQAMGLRRADVYISNICKFRPMIDDGKYQGTKNRAPSIGEMLACLPFITAEINIIQPKIIVALGATAATGLGIEGKVGSLRGRMHDFRSIPVLVTYHPSFLLRREQEDGGGLWEKRQVWEDMLKVMEHVGLPISTKQRGYFSKAAR